MAQLLRKLSLIECMLFFLSFAGGCTLFSTSSHGRGAVLEKWETENKIFRIRVTSSEETGAYLNGAFYHFESAASGSNDWREIVTFRHDDRPQIPREQVRFVNDRIAYLFMGWVYAVTTDGGANWSVWNATGDLPNWQCCNYQLIRDVQLNTDGVGTMKLNPIAQRAGEVPQLHTRDYGRHWVSE